MIFCPPSKVKLPCGKMGDKKFTWYGRGKSSSSSSWDSKSHLREISKAPKNCYAEGGNEKKKKTSDRKTYRKKVRFFVLGKLPPLATQRKVQQLVQINEFALLSHTYTQKKRFKSYCCKSEIHVWLKVAKNGERKKKEKVLLLIFFKNLPWSLFAILKIKVDTNKRFEKNKQKVTLVGPTSIFAPCPEERK